MKEAAERSHALSKVLEQSEHAKDLVDQCASDLAVVNAGLKKELEVANPAPAVEVALAQNEAVESKVHEASDKLAVVGSSLTGEVRNRNLLEHQFAAAIEQQEAARHVALHDILTDLPNRALFEDRLQHGLTQAKRHGWGLAVMFIDLDHFKQINDTFGHDAGDRVLEIVAQRLSECTRSDDTVSRYGGDEFLYLAMEIRDAAQAAMVARKIVDAVRAPCDISAEGVDFHPTVHASIGIALYPEDGGDAATLIKGADRAMYRAKREKSGYAFTR